MSAEQLALLATETAPSGDRPRCRMCALPAWWLQRARTWSPYCGSSNCRNRERICQTCDKGFTVGIDGAGTKYCSAACRYVGYHPGSRSSAPCAWCGKVPGTRHSRGKWPYICADCQHPIRHVVPRLKEHNVPHEMARRLLREPGCEICGINMLERRRQSSGKVSALLVVDHDHDCCPVEATSCGKCVRGFLCRTCNAASGLLYESADNARALAAYLDRWKGAI